MASNPNLRVRISADLADLKAGLGALRGDLAQVKKDAGRAAPNMSGWSNGLRGIRNQLAGIVSVYAAMRGIKVYTELADQAANLTSRLRLATKNQSEFNKAHEEIFQIAQRTSSSLDSVVDLYAKLSQSSGELGLSQDKLLQMTESITQAFQVSGATSQEAAGGLRQLAQAMAGGTLRAEEFNSIIDSGPRIVQALADHFGVSFGKVRHLVNDGKISSEEFAAAMLSASERIQVEFDQLPITMGRALQQVRNAMLRLVGDADDASGAAGGLAEKIQDLARVMESPDVRAGFTAIVNGVVSVTSEVVRGIGLIGKYIDDYRKLEALRRGSTAPRNSGSVDHLNSRLAVVGRALDDIDADPMRRPKGVLRQGEHYMTQESRDQVRARLEAERTELIRAITAQIRDDAYALAFQGTAKEIDFTRPAPVPEAPAGTATTNEPGKSARAKGLSDEERAAQQLQRSYSTYLASLERANELHGENSTLATLNYEIERGALQGVTEDQAGVLREAAAYQDFLLDTAALEGVWASAAQDRTDAMIEGWQRGQEALAQLRAEVEFLAIDALTGFFMDLVEGSKSAGDALRDFVTNFVMSMAQIAARALATALVMAALDAIWPGFSRFLLATGGMTGAGQNHDGGLAGKAGGVRRMIPDALLGHAPRYHYGGIAGTPPLKANEVAAVLERGEEVLTRNDPRHQDNLRGGTGGGGVLVKTPIVAIGDRAVADALAGAAGEDVVITHVRNNWQALSRG